MTRTLHLLLPLLFLALLASGPQLAHAGRLVSISGEAREAEVKQDDYIKLSEQSEIRISYSVTKIADGCSVQVRVYREQNNRWLVVNTVLTTSKSVSGKRTLTLPKGEYRIQVTAKQADFAITVDK